MSGANPYYQFAIQRRYPYAWFGGAGGVLPATRAAETRSLSGLGGVGIGNCFGNGCFGAAGSADMVESGLDENSLPWPAFSRTHIHDPTLLCLSDWPLVRPAGPEPHDPHGDGLGLSDNEQTLGIVLVAGAAAWWLFLRRPRRNPRRRRARRARR